jgi:hypothetical protein
MEVNPNPVTCPNCGTGWELEEAEARQAEFLCTECNHSFPLRPALRAEAGNASRLDHSMNIKILNLEGAWKEEQGFRHPDWENYFQIHLHHRFRIGTARCLEICLAAMGGRDQKMSESGICHISIGELHFTYTEITRECEALDNRRGARFAQDSGASQWSRLALGQWEACHAVL